MMRKDGRLAEVVEHWNPFAKVRKDLFGFIDVLVISGNEMLAVQTTSGANVSARIAKIRATPAAKVWLASPTRRLFVHGWAKRGPRGKAKYWTCRQVEVLPDSEIELT